MQAIIRTRAQNVPANGFITSMGGWNPVQFAEKRLPTLAELDAAADGRPVLVFQGFTGPAATNTPGRAFFTSKGIAVSDTGQIAANAPSMAALNALRAVQTFDDRKRGTAEAMAYSASVGVTTNADMGAFNLPGTPDLQGSFEADTLASADQFRMYDAVLALAREGRMTTRLRIFFLTMDTRPDVPVLSQRLPQHVRRFRRRHGEGVGHRRVRDAVAAVRPGPAHQLHRGSCRPSRGPAGRSSSTACRRRRTSSPSARSRR